MIIPHKSTTAPGTPWVVLAHTSRGKAQRCRCCEKIELRFANVLLKLDENGLDHLDRVLASIDLTKPAPMDGYVVRFAGYGVSLVLDHAEMIELRQLVASSLSGL